jgi:competence protein ComEC
VAGERPSSRALNLNPLSVYVGNRTHVLAISGQHVAILAAVVFFGLRLVAVQPHARAGITVLLTWLYILVAGAPPSAIRARVVATFLLAAKPLGRQASHLHCTN